MIGKTNSGQISNNEIITFIPWGNGTTEPRYNVDIEPTKTIHAGSSNVTITKDLLPSFTNRAAFEAKANNNTSFSDYPSIIYEIIQAVRAKYSTARIWYRLYTTTARVWIYKVKNDDTLEQLAYYPETTNLDLNDYVDLNLSTEKGFKYETYPFGTNKIGGLEIFGIEYF